MILSLNFSEISTLSLAKVSLIKQTEYVYMAIFAFFDL